MKKFLLILSLFFLTATSAHANCAVEKKKEFDKLLGELRKLDSDYAIEARRAFGVVSGYEEFDKNSPRCSHIDKLLDDMHTVIDNLKEE